VVHGVGTHSVEIAAHRFIVCPPTTTPTTRYGLAISIKGLSLNSQQGKFGVSAVGRELPRSRQFMKLMSKFEDVAALARGKYR
jgi:hypothetical protein